MPKQRPNHSLVTLREMLGSNLKELGCLLFPHLDHTKGAKIVGGCQNGKDSLAGREKALRLVVSIFGLRPASVLPVGTDRHAPLRLVSLSGYEFTRAWFLAWTYAGLEAPASGQIIVGTMTLALRVERAAQLYDEFLNRNIPWRTMSHLRGHVVHEDDIEVLESAVALPRAGKSLIAERERMAKKYFSEIGESCSSRPSGAYCFNHVQKLTVEFALESVFEAIGLAIRR